MEAEDSDGDPQGCREERRVRMYLRYICRVACICVSTTEYWNISITHLTERDLKSQSANDRCEQHRKIVKHIVATRRLISLYIDLIQDNFELIIVVYILSLLNQTMKTFFLPLKNRSRVDQTNSSQASKLGSIL